MAKTYTAQELRDAADLREAWGDKDEVNNMLRQAADALEREEKREKKYEYMIKTKAAEFGFLTIESAKEFKQQYKLDEPIFRRTVGEWEEVKE